MTRWLVLIPTAHELQFFPDDVRSAIERAGTLVQISGFGPIVSAVRTAKLIHEHRPTQVLLCGVAGALNQRLTIGQAYRFHEVACYGIGAGCGSNFQTASEMGWQQWGVKEENSFSSITDVIQLADFSLAQGQRTLLTVCAASSDPQDVQWKLSKYPSADAEDMEGFSVASACKMAEVPLYIVRGISNTAGDRNHRRWEISKAMQSAASIVEEIIHS